MSPEIAPSPKGIQAPLQDTVPWTHLNPYPKWHLDQLSRFCKTHGCDRQTDRHTYRNTHQKNTDNNKPHILCIATQPNTHIHPFNGPFSRTTRVSRYQKGKTNLDFTEARDSEWQWHQLGHYMQVCTSLQTDNHASTAPTTELTIKAVPTTLMKTAEEKRDCFCSFLSRAALWCFRCFMILSALVSPSGIDTTLSSSSASSSVHSKCSKYVIKDVGELSMCSTSTSTPQPSMLSTASCPRHPVLSLKRNTNTTTAALALHHRHHPLYDYHYPFNGLFSRTTWLSRYQKGKNSLDLNEATDDGVLGRQWHWPDHMQTICNSLHRHNQTNTSSIFQAGCSS